MEHIDIILTCYQPSSVIEPGLDMIANQTAVKDITLIMVNDCSPNTDCEYQDLRDKYKDKINIKYFKTEKNGGPGVSRQLGLDNVTSHYFMFIDDDDSLADASIIETYLKIIEKYQQENIIGFIAGNFLMFYNEELQYTIKTEDNNAHFGTVFNKDLIDKYNLFFFPYLRMEEDTLFLQQYFYICKKEKAKAYRINKDCYHQNRKANQDSICSNDTIQQISVVYWFLFRLTSFVIPYIDIKENEKKHFMIACYLYLETIIEYLENTFKTYKNLGAFIDYDIFVKYFSSLIEDVYQASLEKDFINTDKDPFCLYEAERFKGFMKEPCGITQISDKDFNYLYSTYKERFEKLKTYFDNN